MSEPTSLTERILRELQGTTGAIRQEIAGLREELRATRQVLLDAIIGIQVRVRELDERVARLDERQ